MDINGFIVLRLPHLNYLVPYRDVIPHVDDVYYAGVDRQRWADVFDEDFYAKKAPAEIMRMASIVKADADDLTGINLCQDASLALRLLAYSNRRSTSNELVAVRSPALRGIKDTFKTDLTVEWIGFDFVALGEWSLIAGGMFMYSEHYSNWLTRSNR